MGQDQPTHVGPEVTRPASHQPILPRGSVRAEEVAESMDRTAVTRGAQHPEQDELARLLGRSATPFTNAIMAEERPKKFIVPKFTPYDGTGDPGDHLSHYQHTMALHGTSDAFLCRTFVTSLNGTALKWFHHLPPNSVSSFYELGRRFLDSFMTSRRLRNGPEFLLNIKQTREESLRGYIARFNAKLTEALMDRARKYINLEEARDTSRKVKEQAQKDDQKRDSQKKDDQRKDTSSARKRARSPEKMGASEAGILEPLFFLGFWLFSLRPKEGYHFTPLNASPYNILKQVKSQKNLRWPEPLKGDPSYRDQTKYYDFHKDRGHTTNTCKALKHEIE
ncbi:hypothetical protein F0562_034334 [Nyssa sinensis]|uniref:Retrotransposon gag domain-containing protein n=1 Tax=Nyssa sinensis TaxID=561372 RepID=A0A5J5AHW9_9ASTE|nr:hypothetical protein F0562_034334 [Nyssa sinensis]